MSSKFDITDGLFLLGFLCVIGALYWLFPYFWKVGYFDWYLRNGASISWAMSLVALIYGDLNNNPFLISSRPKEYAGGYALLFSEVFLTLSIFGVAKRKPKSELIVTSYWGLDQLIAIAVNVVFGTLILSWLLVVAPIQYFVFIVCGAPARVILCSQQHIQANDSKWWANGISEKPITVTAGFTGMVIWILKFLIVEG